MTVLLLERVEEIILPAPFHGELVAHAGRKLNGVHLPGEEPERKAYGLIGGRVNNLSAEVTDVVPLTKNRRYDEGIRSMVDALFEVVGTPSETPMARRGWIADRAEVQRAEDRFARVGSVLLGGYHMHRVAWDHDPTRSTCTALDRECAEGSGLVMFILSMVDPSRPVLRGFFEGCNEREVAVRVANSVALAAVDAAITYPNCSAEKEGSRV